MSQVHAAVGATVQVNTFAEIVASWVTSLSKGGPRFVRRRRSDGEFEAYVRAPRTSKAERLTILTWRGDLWVRFGPPHLFYSVESRIELRRVVRALLSERALFAATYRGDRWCAGTLVPKGHGLAPRRGEHIVVVSWSGQHDTTVKYEPKNERGAFVAQRPNKRLQPTARGRKLGAPRLNR